MNQLNHCNGSHAGASEQQLPCPECIWQRAEQAPVVTDKNRCDDWQLHCIVTHSRNTFVFGQQGLELSRCLVCNGKL